MAPTAIVKPSKKLKTIPVVKKFNAKAITNEVKPSIN